MEKAKTETLSNNSAGIYIDCKNLRKILRSAQFLMNKSDRIIYGTPILELIGKVISDFVMAYDFPDEREYYVRLMWAHFAVLKVDLDEILESGVLIGKDERTGKTAERTKLDIFSCVAKIDDGITKYKNYALKGKTSAD